MIKIQKLKKVRIVILVNLIIILGAFYISNLDVNRMNEYEENFQDYSGKNNLKKAGAWTLTPLVIDDDGGGDYTWLEASSEDWCSGSGTHTDPYIIENLTINGQNSSSCLEIRDSTAYFILRNCKVYNSSDLNLDSGISLRNVNNGIISNNNCSTNNYGIVMQSCDDNLITYNTLNNNLRYGLYAINSEYNTILNNTVIGNDWYGMCYSNCEYNTISNNTVNNHYYYGIRGSFSNYNNFSNNFLNDNRYGYRMDSSNENLISKNYIINSTNQGIGFNGFCNSNIIEDNMILNSGRAIYLEGNHGPNNNNTIIKNEIISSNTGLEIENSNNITANSNYFEDNNIGIWIHHDLGFNSDDCLIYNNMFIDSIMQANDSGDDNYWDNGTIGNYWSDYGGVDADDDGIGDTIYSISGPAGSQDNFPIWNDGIEGSVIFINGTATGVGAHNWTWARDRFWCSGSGTYNDPYIIENLEIDGNGMGNCIEVRNSDIHFIIKNCTVYNSSIITMSQNGAGIKLNNVSNAILIGNNCSSDNAFGIYLYECDNIQILDNIANDNSMGIVLNKSRNCIISDNTASSANAYGITLIESANNQVTDNKALYNSFFGIVCVESSRNNTIYHNNASFNRGYGIIIDLNATNNTISENYANFNDQMGIAIGNSNESVIRGNMVENNMYGIVLTNASQNLVSENYVYNNSFYGIWLIGAFDPCDNNIFFGNDIINNTEAGIYINKPLHTNNLFSKNEFRTNGLHVFDNGTDTRWDDGSIGNYWDNYTGVDSDDDDIGDSPHNIQNNPLRQDNFPIWNDGDDLPPTIKINFPVSSQLIGIIAPAYNVEIHDLNLDTMWYTIDGGVTNVTFSANGTIDQNNWTAHIDGPVTLTFYANDTLGRVNSTQVIINKDITLPTVDLITPTTNQQFGTISPDFIVEIRGNNLDTFWYSLDNGVNNFTFSTNETINQALWSTLPVGNITIRFYANNSDGNIGFAEVAIRKEVDAPIITIHSPQNSDVIGATAPNFNISIVEANLDNTNFNPTAQEPNLDKTWYSLNSGNNITFTGLTGTINQALWDALPEGNVTIRFYANNTLGNIGFQEVTVVKSSYQTPWDSMYIPGYNIVLLLGIISTIAVFLVKKKLKHLN